MSAQLQSVFCVDDDSDILHVLQLSLQTVGGFDVACCDDPFRAVDEIAQFAPDIILLDVMMPGMDGPTTLEALRRHDKLGDTPVVFLTARAQSEDIEHYRSLGAIGVLTKPFDPMTVASEIEALWKAGGDGA